MQGLREKLAVGLRERCSNSTFSLRVIMIAADDAIGNRITITKFTEGEILFTFRRFLED
jgi:hypothetical protein